MSVTDNVDIGDQTGNEIGGGAAKQNFASNLFLQVEKNNPAKMYVAIAVGIIVYLLIQLVTLTRSPLPWFDDTFFASIAESLYRNGELKLSVTRYLEIKVINIVILDIALALISRFNINIIINSYIIITDFN